MGLRSTKSGLAAAEMRRQAACMAGVSRSGERVRVKDSGCICGWLELLKVGTDEGGSHMFVPGALPCASTGSFRCVRCCERGAPQKYPDPKLVGIPATHVFAKCQEGRNRTTDTRITLSCFPTLLACSRLYLVDQQLFLLPNSWRENGSKAAVEPPMATPNCSTYGRSNCSRQDHGIVGLFVFFLERLFGKRSASGRRREAGERWASHARRRGRPQACPVGGWLVHGGRVRHDQSVVSTFTAKRCAASLSR